MHDENLTGRNVFLGLRCTSSLGEWFGSYLLFGTRFGTCGIFHLLQTTQRYERVFFLVRFLVFWQSKRLILMFSRSLDSHGLDLIL